MHWATFSPLWRESGIVVGWLEPRLNTVNVNPPYIAQSLSLIRTSYILCHDWSDLYEPPGLTLPLAIIIPTLF